MKSFKFGRWTVTLPLTALGLFVVFLAATMGSVKYSESPTFCNSCHIMGPYYRAWKNSKHNTVACVECHYPPADKQTLLWKKFQAMSQVVKYVTRTYSSKPFAEVEDASCLRSGCHSERLLHGRVVAKTGIIFDHRPHLEDKRRGRQLRCVSCHSQVMVGSHIEVTYDACFLCHFKGQGEGRDLKPIGGCTGCHAIPKKEFNIGGATYRHAEFVGRGVSCQSCHRDVVRGEGAAPRDRCVTCHNTPETLKMYDDIALLHEKHVTHKNIACIHCHQEIRHGFADSGGRLPPIKGEAVPGAAVEAAAAKGPQPISAHLPSPSFDCGLCHKDKHAGEIDFYSGRVKALGLPEIPSPMFLARVDCSGCHYQKDAGAKSASGVSEVTFVAGDRACVRCHGSKYEGMWGSVREEVLKTESSLAAKAAETAKAVSALPAAGKARPKEILARAQKILDFVGKKRAEHNIYLASVALRRVDADLDEAARLAQAKVADLSEQPLISGSYCAVLCHQKAGVKVPAETVAYKGKTMPHSMHADLMGCAKCHDLGPHRKAPLRKNVDEQVCATCHPK
ncbi:MAG: cytochrome c3 family protein [Elusimicrobiota bacterium]